MDIDLKKELKKRDKLLAGYLIQQIYTEEQLVKVIQIVFPGQQISKRQNGLQLDGTKTAML